MNETKNYSITKSGAVILEGGANRGIYGRSAGNFPDGAGVLYPLMLISVSAGALPMHAGLCIAVGERGLWLSRMKKKPKSQ